jgi:hypothetical protein
LRGRFFPGDSQHLRSDLGGNVVAASQAEDGADCPGNPDHSGDVGKNRGIERLGSRMKSSCAWGTTTFAPTIVEKTSIVASRRTPHHAAQGVTSSLLSSAGILMAEGTCRIGLHRQRDFEP